MTKEALKLALEALEVANSCVDGYYIPKGKTHLPEIELAITAIKEALAQPEQEPVAWMNDSTPSGIFARHMEGAKNFGCTIPLYTTPPQRKPPKPGDGSALFYEAVRLLDNAIFAQSGDVIRHDSAAHREAVDFFNQVFTRLDSPPPPQRPSRSDIKPLTKIIPMAQPAVTESHKQESVETLDHKAIGKQAYESGYSTGYMDCAVKMQAKKEQEPVTDNTYGYAKSLAEAIFKQHFSSDEHYASGRIVWDVNDTVIGILTQIDNMVAGMVRKPEQEPINDGWQITFANGHSGFGVYAHMDEHPEEGSILLCAVPQWAKDALKTTTPLPCQTCEALARTVMMDQTGRDA